MDIHELHDSHSSNLPAIIIIFSKTALPYTPNQLTWTLGISAFLISETKTLGRVKRLMAFIVLIRSGLAVNDCYASPPAAPGSSSTFLDGRFRSTWRRHECSQIHGRIMAHLGTGRTGNVQQKSWRSSPVHLFMTMYEMYDCPKTVLIQILILPQSQRCWTLRLHWRSAAKSFKRCDSLCVWTAVWLCVKL